MSLRGSRLNVECFQQRFAHKVWRLAKCFGHPQIHIGLAEVNGYQLRMAIGHVQQAGIAKWFQVVQLFTVSTRQHLR